MKQSIAAALFETRALRVSPAEQPFWYTSGLFGPYYINTHFLFGGEEAAGTLLKEIEAAASGKRELFHNTITRLCMEQYESDPTCRHVIDRCIETIRGAELSFDLISGGERRDFFFSLPIAALLGKGHLSIFKDLSCYCSDSQNATGQRIAENELAGQRVLHIADLITEASSYVRAWIPAVTACGATIVSTLAIVDRCQGGVEILKENGIQAITLLQISPELFSEALALHLINTEQQKALNAYYEDPHAFVKSFLAEHPDFLQTEAAKDAKTAERVARLQQLKL